MIPFNKPFLTGKEIAYIADAHNRGQLAGDGYYTNLCNEWLKKNTEAKFSLLTHSCTAALEMSAILLDIKPGDEIIMPSFTFVSTANSFVLRGGVPVFVDIREDTLNINESLIEGAITSRTKAIVPVHYAGVGCEMDVINKIANANKLSVVEDAAQGVMSSYKGRALGSIGDLGCFSFHETKNIISGEGGALLINNSNFAERAEVILEKGTNRKVYFRGQVDKYTWMDIGSSYLPGEITAAFLTAQMEEARRITDERLYLWNVYHEAFKNLESDGLLRRPSIPDYCEHNGHMYYLILPDLETRGKFIESLGRAGIQSVFHYVPLHESPMGAKFMQRTNLHNSTDLSQRLVRLPLWVGLKAHQGQVIDAVYSFFKNLKK